MKLRYTPQAQLDLREIKGYISKTLMNKTAASRIAKAIIASCSHLKENPYLGKDLSVLIDEPTDYRYIICENYLAFYTVRNDFIAIERILDGRTDYIQRIITSS